MDGVGFALILLVVAFCTVAVIVADKLENQ